MDVYLPIMKYAKKNATTPDEKYVDNLPHLFLKLVGTTILIVNVNTIVDSFALRGKKTKSAFSNSTLVIQRIESKTKYDLWRFQVHCDATTEEIESFLKRIKSVTTFLAVEDSQYVPDNVMDTDTDSTMYNSAPVINNASSSHENTFRMPQGSSLNWNIKSLHNDCKSADMDSNGNSISLLRNLQIEEGASLKANYALAQGGVQLKPNHTFVPPRIDEASLKTNSNSMPYPGRERGSFNYTDYGKILPSIYERRPFDTINRIVPPSIVNRRPFETNSEVLQYPLIERGLFKNNNKVIQSRFAERMPFDTTNRNVPNQTVNRSTFVTNSEVLPYPTLGRGPSTTNNEIMPSRFEVSRPSGISRSVPPSIVNRRSFATESEVLPYPVCESGSFKTCNDIMPSCFEERIPSNTANESPPHPLLVEKIPSKAANEVMLYTDGGGIPPKTNYEITPSRFEEIMSFNTFNQNIPSSVIAERKPTKTCNEFMSYPVGKKESHKPNNDIMLPPTKDRKQFETVHVNLPSSIAGRPFLNVEVQPSITEERRAIDERMLQAIGERKTFRSTNLALPYPTEERRPFETTNDMKPSTIVGEQKYFDTTNESLPLQINGRGSLNTDVNLTSSDAEMPLIPASGVGPNQTSDEIAHMDVDTDVQNEALSLRNDLTNQSSQYFQAFSLIYVDAEVCISEPLRLGPLLIRKVMEQIPETSLTVLTDPDCNNHFKAVEEAFEKGTDCSDFAGCAKQPIRDNKTCNGQTENSQGLPQASLNCSGNSEREIMKAFIRSDAFLPFIEGIKSLLNDDSEE